MAELDQIQRAAREQFDRQSLRYGRSHILARVDDVESALEGLDFSVGSRALDVGTGGGHTALCLARRGFLVTASDLAPAMLANTRRLIEEEGFSVETNLHEAEVLPYPDASFDLVSCRVAAHHFSDRQAFVRESARVLKPGGYFLLIDGSTPDDNEEAEEWLHLVEKLRDPSHGRFSRRRGVRFVTRRGSRCSAAR